MTSPERGPGGDRGDEPADAHGSAEPVPVPGSQSGSSPARRRLWTEVAGVVIPVVVEAVVDGVSDAEAPTPIRLMEIGARIALIIAARRSNR